MTKIRALGEWRTVITFSILFVLVLLIVIGCYNEESVLYFIHLKDRYIFSELFKILFI